MNEMFIKLKEIIPKTLIRSEYTKYIIVSNR